MCNITKIILHLDVDECENDWACHPSTQCINGPGSFECVCPSDHDDYVIMNGTICERDECADIDQGGCSHNCTNTIGSYVCFCPHDLSLLEDGLTCSKLLIIFTVVSYIKSMFKNPCHSNIYWLSYQTLYLSI